MCVLAIFEPLKIEKMSKKIFLLSRGSQLSAGDPNRELSDKVISTVTAS